MQAFEEPDAGRQGSMRRIGAAVSAPSDMARQASPVLGLAARAQDLARRLAARLADRRRRARPRLESWMAIDPRVLADIGVARADVQAVVDGAVPSVQLAAHGPADAETGELRPPRRRWRPALCLVAERELDAAA